MLSRSFLTRLFYGLMLMTALFTLSALKVQSQMVTPTAQPEPAPMPDGTLRRIRVPILMYHYISQLPADADAYRRDLTISPDVFRGQIQYLHDDGYNTISMYQLNDALLRGTPLPAKPVILTFDDGYIDHYVNVFPILREFGFTGTFFIITGRPDSNDPDYMTWQQIREMSDAGMSMESHTKNHPDLRGRAYDFLVYELLGSYQSLEAYLGKPPRMLAYPIGHYDDGTLEVMRTMSYWRAVTTEPGMLHTTDNRFEMPRVRVNGNTPASGMAYLLGGSWLEN